MKKNKHICIPDYLTCAAFLVEDNIVTQVNHAAEQRQIPVGANIHELISIGSQEYDSFRSGKMYLQLHVAGTQYNACVSRYQDHRLFCIFSEYTSKELQTFSLVSSIWREPLQNILSGVEQLYRNLPENAFPSAAKSIGQINRNLYQLIRSVGNMSDASVHSHYGHDAFQYMDANAYFNELAVKLQSQIPTDRGNILYTGLKKQIYTMLAPLALERAICNLLSNAIKFSSHESSVSLRISSKNNRLYIVVENTCDPAAIQVAQFFDNYLREPGLEENRIGIGLGLSVVRNIASAHRGALLVSRKKPNVISFTMTLAVQEESLNMLKSSRTTIIDHTGGFDTILVELSDILPDEMYENI